MEKASKRVLIADLFSKGHIEGLKKKGFEVAYDDKLNGDKLKEFMAKFKPHVLVVRSTKVTAAHIKACDDLQVVIRAGSGVDTIDLKAATEAGVAVGNCPGKNADAVAELVFAIMIAIDRRIADNVADFRAKKWNKGEYSKASGLKGRNIGIIGFGYIGKEVTKRALAFGMNVYGFSPSLKSASGVNVVKSIDEMLPICDVLVLTLPATASTKGMVNKTFLSKMKKDAQLINVSRSTITVESDILEHLEANKGFRYGTDVFDKEPADKSGTFENKLAMHPRVVGSHHIGASTTQAEEAIGDEAYRMILEFAETNKLPNTVNSTGLKPKASLPKPKL